MPNLDHYLTLDVDYKASDEEIKQAFRRLAKKFHPDKNPGEEKEAERRFKQIIEAYKVLSNHKSRACYDQILESSQDIILNKHRNDLQKRAKKDNSYLCRLILFELINQNPQKALEIYDRLIAENPFFSFDKYISEADMRDCEFLLAEAYHKKGELWEAARLYEKVLEMEKKKAYFRNFAQEIRLMLKDVYLQFIVKAKNSEEITINIKKLLSLELPKSGLAQIYKKAAESYYCIGDINSAKKSLERAFKENPKLTGAKRISKKLGIK